MSDESLHTTQLHDYLARVRAGDHTARDELLRTIGVRLDRLTRQMLRSFPEVRRWAETEDVLQGALLRLVRALNQIEPESVRHFFALAARLIRQELIDLARYFRGRPGLGRGNPTEPPGEGEQAFDPPDRNALEDDLDMWTTFHETVERLPAEEREVVSLAFYHGWTQAEIGALFGVDERTIRRRWRSACNKLHTSLGAEVPETFQ